MIWGKLCNGGRSAMVFQHHCRSSGGRSAMGEVLTLHPAIDIFSCVDLRKCYV